MKRFRIFDADSQTLVEKCDTTEQVYKTFKSLDHSKGYFFVDCVVDDIEVTAQEFMEAWEQGEHFGDLQFF